MAKSYEVLLKEYREESEQLESKLSAADSDRNRLRLLLEEERDKAQALDRMYANAALEIRKLRAKVEELEKGN